jgi:hypothetical protein
MVVHWKKHKAWGWLMYYNQKPLEMSEDSEVKDFRCWNCQIQNLKVYPLYLKIRDYEYTLGLQKL